MNPLDRAILQLANSKNSNQRRKARTAFRCAVSKLLKQFPLLDDEGKPKPEAGHVVMCPLCNVPFANWTSFAAHVRKHWGKGSLVLSEHCSLKCEACAVQLGIWRTFNSDRKFGLHLAGVHHRKDPDSLKLHIVQGGTEAAFK